MGPFGRQISPSENTKIMITLFPRSFLMPLGWPGDTYTCHLDIKGVVPETGGDWPSASLPGSYSRLNWLGSDLIGLQRDLRGH